MLVLGLDSSTPAVSVAVVDTERGPLAEQVVVDGRRHGELLAMGIRAALAAAGAGGRDLEAIAVGLGPGPFTGLRVGVVTAAALGDAWGLPTHGVCSLDALGVGERVAVTDARRREIYWARYDAAGDRLEGPAVTTPAALFARFQGQPVVGDGAHRHTEIFGAVPELPRYPSAVRIAELAVRVDPGPLLPFYLRRPDAEAPGPPKRVTA